MKKQFAANNQLLLKIRDNSFKFQCERSTIRFKELEYHTRRDFYDFHRKLRETFDIVFRMFRDAFKRDTFLANNLYQTQIHPSGQGLYTRTDTHNDLKMFKVDVIRKGFRKPKDIPVFSDPNLTTYRGSEASDREATTNIKTAGGFKKRRSVAADSSEPAQTNIKRSMSSRSKGT